MKIFENTAFGHVTEALIIKTWKTKTNFADNHFHNILGHYDLLRNFPLSQVKRCPSITYKHGICELSNNLPNHLRFRTLGNGFHNILFIFIFIIFSDILMFYRIILYDKETMCDSTYKHGMYELPHDFPNDLRLRILGN